MEEMVNLEEFRFPIPESFRLDLENIESRGTGSKDKSLFLKDPVPWSWLEKALDLGYSTSKIGVALWVFVGLKRTLSPKIGVKDISSLVHRDPSTVQRALKKLEEKNLIVVKRLKGSKNIISIVKAEGSLKNLRESSHGNEIVVQSKRYRNLCSKKPPGL